VRLCSHMWKVCGANRRGSAWLHQVLNFEVSLLYKWHKLFVVFLLISILGVLLRPTVYASSFTNAIDLSSSSLTVKSTFTMVSDPEEEKRIMLAGFATEDNGTASVLSVTWELEASGWFASWYIKFSSEQGLLPVEVLDSETNTLLLGPVAPVANHTYEVILSYNPLLGYLSFALSDQTTGKRICYDHRQVNPYAGPLFRADEVNASSTSYPWYEPSGTSWDVGASLQGGFTPMRLLELQNENWIRIMAPGPLPGDYLVELPSGDLVMRVKGADLVSGENLLQLFEVSLPLGVDTLVLQYLDQDKRVFVGEYEIVVGKVSASLSQLSLDSSSHVLSGNLVVQSESSLHDVAMRMRVTFSSIVWSTLTSNYVLQPHKSITVDLGHLTVSDGSNDIPISFPMPAQPGLWRADFDLSADPAIIVVNGSPNIVFSTDTWTLLGNAPGSSSHTNAKKPIRIGTYNILGFAGYPSADAKAVLGNTNDPRRISYFTNVIRALDCDILGIQEGKSVEQMKMYAKAAGMEVAAFPAATSYPGGVFTTFPILETRSYNNPSYAGRKEPFSRTGSATLLNVHGELLWVVNIHAMVNDVMMRELEAEILDRELPNLIKVTPNIVVTGDFNSLPGKAIHEALRKHNLHNAMQILAMILPNQYQSAIDCVYVSENLVGYLQAGHQYSNPGLSDSSGQSTWRDSDHRPVVIEMYWPR
jgi:endonuclease/exonuclease/phosphatase family metal-dependent hydrolase